MRYLIFLVILSPLLSFGIIDTRSAGYSKTFVDFKSGGSGFSLNIERTYNSRSLYNGLFGFGWCSNLETRLAVLPDGSLKISECGGGMEIVYHPKGKVPDIKGYIAVILEKIKKRKIRMTSKALKKLENDLLQSQTLRADFLKALDIKGRAKTGMKYYAQGRFKEFIVVKPSTYTRSLPSGKKEVFNKDGRLVKAFNKEGHFLEISWKSKQIQVQDQRGARLIFSLNKQAGKIKTAKFKSKTVATYKHDGENLVKIKNSFGETIEHRYDNLHNLTKNIYPDKTTEILSYNINKDWVIGFKDRRECKETYKYGVNRKTPDHYFSLVQKKCGRKIVNKSKYEFWHKNKQGGGKYLHRAKARVNGRLKTDVIYHPVFGTPVSFYKNGVRTVRDYYANGFLKEKDNSYQNVKYSKYNQRCRKPELVSVAYKNINSNSKKKIMKKDIIRLNFDRRCRLVQAKKSNDEWIKVKHDSNGRIISMEDQSNKKVTLAWHKSLNKPVIITRVGVGAIKIVYNKSGEVVDLKGPRSGPSIIAQVTSVFNSFLSTLSPVAEEMVIL